MKKLIKLLISIITMFIILVYINISHAIILNDEIQFISGILYNFLDNTNIFAIDPREGNNLTYTNATEMFANYEKNIKSITDKNNNILDTTNEKIATGDIITIDTDEQFTTVLYGDATGDGVICTNEDIEVIKKDYLNREKSTGVYKLAADLSIDDKLNVKDIQKMLQKQKGDLTTGLVDEFPDKEGIHYATFMADDVEVEKIKFTIKDGLFKEIPSIPEKIGYESEWEKYELIEEDIIIKANYTPIEYEITYELDEGIFSDNPKLTYTVEDEDKELGVPEKDNYVFEGWYETEDLTGEKLESLEGKTGNLTLYAKYLDAKYKTNLDDYYLTLKDAIDSANSLATVTTITPLVDTIETEGATFTGTQTLTLNLAGKTIKLDGARIINNKNLKISGSGILDIISGTNRLTNKGTLTIESGTIKATGTNAILNSSGTTIFSGGTIEVTNGAGIYNYSTGTVKITGGTIKTNTNTNSGIVNYAAGTIEMTGGEIIGTGNGIYNSAAGVITVTGGIIDVSGSYAVRGYTGTVKIGTKEATPDVSITDPNIKGGTTGVQIDGGILNFYDGIIKGTTGKSIEGTVTEISDGYVIVNGIETIEEVDYETSVLGPSAPVITAKLVDANGDAYESGDWTNKVIYVTLESENIGAGIAEYQWQDISEGIWRTSQITLTDNIGVINFKVPRNSTVEFRAIDNNGVISETSSIIIRRETTAPTATLDPNGGTYTIEADSTKVTLEATIIGADEGGSSLNSVEIAWSQSTEIEPSTYTLISNNSKITKDVTGGPWYLWIRVTDNAGNIYTTVNSSNGFIINYEITYNANNGTGAPDSQIKNYGEDLVLSNTSPTRANYVFKGWATTSTATSGEYNPGDTYSANASATLYAVWSEAVASTTMNSKTTYYESIQEAIDAAGTTTATVKVLKSVTADSFTIASGQNITLNLNSKTVTLSGTSLVNNGTLKIAGTVGTITASGAETIINNGTLTQSVASKIMNTSTSTYYTIENYGNLNISSIDLNSTYRGIHNNTTGKIAISGGTFYTYNALISNEGNSASETSPALKITGSPTFSVSTGNVIVNRANSVGLVYIDGGTIISSSTTSETPAILNSGNGKVIIKSGTIDYAGTNAAIYNGYSDGTTTGTIEMRGGTVTATAAIGISNRELGSIIISGGTINAEKTAVHNQTTGNIEISGGSITSTTQIGARAGAGTLTVLGDDTVITGSNYGVSVTTGTANILSGTISATNGRGLYTASGGTINLGENEEETPIVDLEYPNITGTTYGIQVASGGTFNFYDGIITGPDGASISGAVNETPTGYIVRKTTSGTQEIAVLGSSGPIITAKYTNSSGSTYKSGTWTNKNVYVQLTTADTGAGIKQYQWKEGASGTWKTSSLTTTDNIGTITFTGNRNSTIYFRSIDNNDVISEESAIVIRKETTAPSNLTIDRAYKAFPNNSYRFSNFTMTDDYTVTTTSTNPFLVLNNMERYTNIKEIVVKFAEELEEDAGVFQIYYTDDSSFTEKETLVSSTKLTAGTTEMRIEVPNITNKYIRLDIGNISGVSYKIEGIYFVTDDTLWNNSNIIAELTATDTQSGIKQYQWYENSAWTTRALTTSNGEGEIKYTVARNEAVQFRVLDNAGNISSTVTSQINIDLTKPTVTLGTNGGTAIIAAGSTTANISSTLTAADTGGSGLKTLEYAWSQSNTTEPTTWTTFTNEATVTKAATGGNWYLWTRVIDNAGNRATTTKVSNVFTVQYQVTFDPNEGTGAPADQTKTKGTALTLSKTVPTRKGYIFEGWGTSSTTTTVAYKSGASYTADSSIKLYAIWKAKEITVTFMRNTSSTDTTSTTQKFTYGETGQKFASTGWTNTGHTLSGWALTSDATTKKYTVTSGVSDDWINTYSPAITLYAVWTANTYTITYDQNYLDEDLWGDTYLTTEYAYATTAPTSKVATANTSAKYGKQLEFTMGTGTGGVYYTVPTRLTVGTQYTWSIFVKASSACTLNMGCEQGGRKSVNVTTSWQRIRYTFTATETTYYNFTFYNNSGWTSGDILYIHSLELMEGAPTNITTSNKTYGTQLGTLTTPTRTGYTFKGWYTAPVGGTKISSTTAVPAKNTTYYAQWIVKSYTVTYDYSTNGGTASTLASATVNYGVNIDLTPTATKDGWTFVGWNTDSAATSKLSSLKMGTSNVTLYAIYKKTLTGTFKYYNDQSTTKSVTIYNTATSGKITSPAALGTPDGYTFRHWSASSAANASKTVAASTSITLTANKTYYASYSKTVTGTFYYCTLAEDTTTFSSAGQSSTTATATQYIGYTGTKKESDFTVPAVVTGSFGGAAAPNYVGVATAVSTATTVTPTTANTKFYAVYDEDITFYYYDGTNHTSSSLTRYMLSNGSTYGTALSGDVPTPASYSSSTFKAWSYDATKYATTYRRTPTATGVNKLYAIYVKSITATFNYHDGSAAASTTASAYRYYVSNESEGVNTYNTNITVPDVVKENRTISNVTYTYRGVSTATTANATVATPTTASTTYYASYSYTVKLTFNGNNATSGTAPSDISKTAYMNYAGTKVGASITMPSNPFTRTGYTFTGWILDSTTNTQIYAAGTAYTYTASHTVYAKWAGISYTVNYYNGSTLLGSSAHTYGTAKALTTMATLGGTKDGFTFYGWTKSTSATSRSYTDGQSVSNLTSTSGGTVTLYAIWQRTATFYSGASKATTATATQYYNSKGGNYSVTTPTPTAITNWSTLGWRNDTTAGTKEYSSATAITASSVTYYAVYSRNATFYSGIAKATSEKVTQYYNSNGAYKVTAPALANIAEIDSWTALGWKAATTADSSIYECGSSITVSNATYYAAYSRTVTVAYNGNGSTSGSTASHTATQYYNSYGSISSPKFTLKANGFTKTGHTFSKWADGSTSGTQYAASASYTFAPAVDVTTLTKTMYAIWKINSYTVTYDYSTNGGTEATKTSATVNYNAAIDLTPTATKDGWTFVGWNTSSTATTKLTSLKMGTSNVTLYAIYSKTLTGTFKYYNNQTNTQKVTIYNTATSGKITSPAALGTPDGYTFRHWSTSNAANASKTVAASTAITLTENKTYYASYSKTVTGTFYYCTLAEDGATFSSAGQSSATATATQYIGYTGTKKESNFTVPTAVTGSFGGTAAPNYVGVAKAVSTATTVTPTTANTKFYAVYDEDIKFYYYDGTNHTSSSLIRYMLSNGSKYGTALSGDVPVPAKYDSTAFLAWSYDATKYTTDYRRTPLSTGVSSLYAIYCKTVTATFNYHDGSAAASTTASAYRYYISKSGGVNTYNNNITIPDAVKANRTISSVTYTYRGVSTASKGNSTVATPTTANTTYYASYSYTITISFDGNGATSGTAPTSLTGTGYMNYAGTKIGITKTLPSNPFTKTGRDFGGWNTNTAGTGTNRTAGTSYTFTASDILYAKWDIKTIVVTFMRNTSSSDTTSATQEFTYGEASQKFSAKGWTKTGHTLKGWAFTSDATTAKYTVTSGVSDAWIDSYSPAVTLYAVWEINSYTVTYDYSTNGGTSATKTTATVNYNAAIDLTPTATKSGWTFVGWNTDKDETAKLSSLKMGTSNVTLYAIYKKTLTGTFKYYNDQSTTKSITIYNTATSGNITSPAASGTPSGYTFRHWSTSSAANASKTVAASTSITLTANKTYYASYSKTVTGTFYYCTADSTGTTYTGVAQSSATATATQYIGYTGTKVESNFTVPTVVTESSSGIAAETYKGVATAVSSATMVTPTTANTKFYAVYTESLTFYYYNGSSHTSTALTRRMLTNGTSYSCSLSGDVPTPSKYDSASFLAWSTDSTKYAQSYRRTPTATGVNSLYAIYYKSVTATFNYHDGSAAASTTASANRYYVSKSGGINTYNTNITVPDVVKENRTISSTTYTYRGVSTASTGNATVATPTTANTTYYASYSYTVTIKFNGNNATSGTAPSNISKTAYMNYAGTKVKASVTMPANPFTRTGYTFCGWNLDSATSSTTYTAGTAYSFQGSHTLYAKWTGISYTVNYYNGSTKLGSSSHTYGTAKALTTMETLGGTKSGFTFYGWTTSTTATSRSYTDGQSVSTLTSTSGGTVTLYAIWQRTATFYSGLAKVTTATATQYYNSKGANYSLTTKAPAAITGWTASGWRNDTTAGAKEFDSSTAITSSSTTYYAVYTRTLTVAYNGNSATSGSMTSHTGTQYYNSNGGISGLTVTLKDNAFTRTGYTFSNWALNSATGTAYAEGASYTFKPGVSSTTVKATMYAVWLSNNFQNTTTSAYFVKLSDALAEAETGETIKVLKTTASGVETANAEVATDKTITIDTGSSLTTDLGSYRILAYGAVTINGTGTITSSSSSSTVIVGETGTLTLNSATLKNTSTGTSAKAVHNNGGYVYIKSGKVTGTNIGIGSDNTVSTITISGGTITGTNSYGVGTLGSIKISGGTITGARGIVHEETATSLEIVDATVKATSTTADYAAVTINYTTYMENVTVNGGNVGILSNGTGTATVKNCEVTATKYGIKSAEGGRFIITGTTITSDFTGIIMHGGQLSVTSGCEIIGNGDNGVHYYENTGGYFNTEDSIITGNVNGVFNHGSTEMRIISGTITGKTSAGVKNYSGSTGSTYIGRSSDPLLENPYIIGGFCALHNASGAKMYYYNGALEVPLDGECIYGTLTGYRINHEVKTTKFTNYYKAVLVASTSTASLESEVNNSVLSSTNQTDLLNSEVQNTINNNVNNIQDTNVLVESNKIEVLNEDLIIKEKQPEVKTVISEQKQSEIESTEIEEIQLEAEMLSTEKVQSEENTINNSSSIFTELNTSSSENNDIADSTIEKVENIILPESEIAIKDDEDDTSNENTNNSVQ